MKQIFIKRLSIVAIALIAVPSVLFAQKEKDDKDKKDKKDVQQIIITRNGEKDDKVTVEIDGDKVKVNGKDIKDLKDKDVSVRVNTVKGANVYRMNNAGSGWNMDFNDDGDMTSIFSEDENRAMLGVNTEGGDDGVKVQSVISGSGAEKAGLKKGDILVRIGDKKIESTDDVTETVRAHKPGEKINITFNRDGKEQKVTAELGKWKGINMSAMAMPRIENMGGAWTPAPPEQRMYGTFSTNRPKLGLSIQDTDDGNGVKVLDVDDESNAAKAGIKEDDIITGVDDQTVKSTDDVTRAVRVKDKYTFTFHIKRNGKAQDIEVKMPRKLKTADL